MTFDLFLFRLAGTRGWRLTKDGAIRKGKHCPISYLGKGAPCTIGAPSKTLGLSWHTTQRIVGAADGYANPKMRKRLLKACGLKERKAVADA